MYLSEIILGKCATCPDTDRRCCDRDAFNLGLMQDTDCIVEEVEFVKVFKPCLVKWYQFPLFITSDLKYFLRAIVEAGVWRLHDGLDKELKSYGVLSAEERYRLAEKVQRSGLIGPGANHWEVVYWGEGLFAKPSGWYVERTQGFMPRSCLEHCPIWQECRLIDNRQYKSIAVCSRSGVGGY